MMQDASADTALSSNPVPAGPVCWTLTDGRPGNANPARGLASALGLVPAEKTLRLAAPWRWLPPAAWPPRVMGLGSGSDALAPPWPDLVISCGRKAIGPALEIKRRSGGAALAVHIQHPRIDPARFDLVICPAHDRLKGPNVVVTAGTIHGLTRAALDAAAEAWRNRLGSLPHPRIAVLIGGSNKAYRMDTETGQRIGTDLARLAAERGAGLMVTLSNRTGSDAAAAIRTALDGTGAWIWDGTGDNPYRGMLGLADRVLVTVDSVNMISEAAATGRPVETLDLPAVGRTAKFERFRAAMAEAGVLRAFDGRLEEWSYDPPDDTVRAAERVRALLTKRHHAD
jgi:mitochondrial fission protein ELM1